MLWWNGRHKMPMKRYCRARFEGRLKLMALGSYLQSVRIGLCIMLV
jgi:hypothetical protein